MILKGFKFLDETDTTGESHALICSGANQLTLTVEADAGATIDLTVSGLIDNESDEWHELGAIPLTDYTPVSNIDDTGAYAFIVTGINKVKVSNNSTPGNCIVFGTLSD